MANQLYRDSHEFIERENYIKNTPDRHMESQDTMVEEFLKEFPEYWMYLKIQQPDLPEFPYGFFGDLTDFITIKYKEGDLYLLKRIFNFLEKMSNSDNINIMNLLMVGCLECFDNHKDVLPELVELMPKDLKNLFLKHFSEYLD